MKERWFHFTVSTDDAMVECRNCGWKPNRREIRGLEPQQVFDLSNHHECEGVESYADWCARDAAELAAWREANRARMDETLALVRERRRLRRAVTVELPEDGAS